MATTNRISLRKNERIISVMGGKEQKAGETETHRSGREREEVHVVHLQPFGHQVTCTDGMCGALKNGR